jgi:hypothetical protein
VHSIRFALRGSPLAQAEKVVVLANDFPAGSREVKREGRHVAAEIVDLKNQFLGKVVLLPPQRPPNAQRRETKFMAGSIDGFYPRQTEVPEQLRLHEGREESAAGSVDVDGDVEPGLGLQLVQRHADLVDRLELQGERDAEGNDHADGVFIAALEHFFRGEQQALAFHGNFADFDVEVAAELVPADLDRAHDEVRSVDGFALGALAFAPLPLEGQAAEHGCLAGAGGGAANGAGGFRGVPQIGQHVDAALFDGRGLRVFILVDHVLVGGLVHELLDFGFDPGGAEGGEILLRVAVEDELIVDGLVDGLRVLRRLSGNS